MAKAHTLEQLEAITEKIIDDFILGKRAVAWESIMALRKAQQSYVIASVVTRLYDLNDDIRDQFLAWLRTLA